jgi:gliding motility-associated-like protein
VIPYGGANIYKDYVNNYVSSQGNFCYYIEALEGTGNPYLFMDTSFSNTACTSPDPLLFVPNAFTPDGRNPEFLPIAGFTDIHLYDFRIWSRWGDVIFESKEPKQGWDGTFKGKPAPEGVYFWVIELSGSGDAQIKKAGTVNLIR